MSDYSNLAILVVDDSSTMRVLVSGMLQHLGFRAITEAGDGKAALEAINYAPFDIVISDWHMAPMDGLSLLRQVQRDRRSNKPSFIFVTIDTSLENRTMARQEGADAFIAKPFKLETLKVTIEQVLA